MAEVASAEPALVAVLAGGAGERLGGAKALVELGGRTLISYPLQAAREAGLEAIVVAKRESSLPQVDERVVYEPASPRHPLCGLVAALRDDSGSRARERAVLAVACDMPFLEPALLRWLAARPDEAVVAEVDGELQPFPGLYRRIHREALAAALETERTLRGAVRALRPRMLTEAELRAFGDPRRLCFSVNDERDLQTARAWLGG
jgi:molybdopterin-guanine dinucleotide biosynthesis protein A